MPYVTDSRVSGEYPQSKLNVSSGLAYSHVASTKYEAVYSFRTGSRANSVKPGSEDIYLPPKGDLVGTLAYRKKFIERQLTNILSDGRAAPTHFLIGDVGHEFGSAKTTFSGSFNTVRSQQTGVLYDLTNVSPLAVYTLVAGGTNMVRTSPMSDLDGFFGQKGLHYTNQGSAFGIPLSSVRMHASNHINEMSPFKQQAGIMATLIELIRGDVPSILGDLRKHYTMISRLKASGIKDAGATLGGEYLNTVFGWTPIISDIKNSIKVLATLDHLLFPPDSTRRSVKRVIHQNFGSFTGSEALSYFSPLGLETVSGWSISKGTALTGGSPQPFGDGIFTASEKVSVWTTARFRTGLKPNERNNGHLDRLQDLLGLEITPALIWELTPWSWLIDWFSNIGKVIENLSNLGLSNTILNYAYATVRREATQGAWLKPRIVTTGNGARSFSGDFIYNWTTDQKVRIAASPFGFGVDLSALNASQWSILVALGLARSR